MDYIIFDLEWNQPQVKTEMLLEPVCLTGEIIEIGAVKLNERFMPVDELRLYITPKYYTKMHRKVASLTGIHNRDLSSHGMPFPEAFAAFREWCGEDSAYMTWSMSDLPMLVENMQLHGIDTTELPAFCDIQRIFGREIMRDSSRYSLNHAMEILKEQGDVAHDALHDARNTAKVCSHLDLEDYLEEYMAGAFAPDYIRRAYGSVTELLGDEDLMTFACPWCGASIVCEPWFAWSAHVWVALAVCDTGDEFLVWVETLLGPDGSFRAKRLIYEVSDDLWELYQDKKEAQRGNR